MHGTMNVKRYEVLTAVLLKFQVFYGDAVSSFRRILMPSSAESSCQRRAVNVFETVITLPGRYEASLAATTPCRLQQCMHCTVATWPSTEHSRSACWVPLTTQGTGLRLVVAAPPMSRSCDILGNTTDLPHALLGLTCVLPLHS
jgi:hypothetical protein